MDVLMNQPARMALSMLGGDDRRRVMVWLDYLKRWHEDEFVRSHSKKLDTADDVFVFRTSSDFRIFFTVADDHIEVLDITRAEALASFEQ